MSDPAGGPTGQMARFRSMLETGNPIPSTDAEQASKSRIESTGRALDLSAKAIDTRLGVTSIQLHAAVKDHLDDAPHLHTLVDELVDRGGGALKALGALDVSKFTADPGLLSALEVIVRSDGSRPSFMIRDGDVDLSTSPAGAWDSSIEASRDMLEKAVLCVGRIDVPGAQQGFEGTGFLIQKNLIMTNRHVLQVVADRDGGGVWHIKAGTSIDFGHEFRGTKTYPRRALTSVVFAGKDDIDFDAPIDHAKLDLVLIEIENPAAGERAPVPLGLDIAPDWADPGQTIYTIGYPGRPPLGSNPPTLLEQIFQSTYGYKRLAPGFVIPSAVASKPWTVAHDATTLGGNSGSVVLVMGREQLSAAIHYGGRSAEPRENWGHIIGRTLDSNDGTSAKTLRDYLKEYEVVMSDRNA